ncbi:CAP domain-containing protein [Flavivirga jejuensis]|uniref:CAP domain-containing protein n=1 Tax=Flavivirga jejuensis TaxID=870487 RepID=A0ABT8WQV1_9FLAO|nr:CAP domain-containing protein [Flavivirga jejuensis]MDO5975553.1 CAP domain-containing protein [Flavivirga jejuensis]
MKKQKLFGVLIFMLFFSFLNAQKSDFNHEKLSDLLAAHVNNLRIKLGKLPLKRDADLAKAAKLQSDYIAEINSLTHVQVGTKFIRVKDRVSHFSRQFSTVGENILYTKPVRLSLNSKALEKLAFDMFRSWKNSPGHYANMILDDYKYGDFGFTYNSKSKRIFAAQVFGKKGVIISGQLSENAFGIKKSDNSCKYFMADKGNSMVNMGNAITIEFGGIYLKFHSKEIVEEIIENPNDGIAIDLVEREQLVCYGDNKLDVSPIYDGVMLSPVYRDSLLPHNLAENKKRFVTFLGVIPEHMRGKDLSPNLILIKDGKKCSYNVPTSIPSKRYDLRHIEPLIKKPEVTLKLKGVNGIRDIIFDFKTGRKTPVEEPEINLDSKKLFAIDIKSFTSIDGNTNTNSILHTERARFIKNLLKNKITNEVPFDIQAKENWELCQYQIELLGLEEHLGDDKEEIKQYIKNNLDPFWENSLNLQRKSKAILYEYGEWLETDPNFLFYNLTDALLTKNYDLANRVLFEMYNREENDVFFNEEFIIDKLFDKKELVQNVSALLLKEVNNYNLDNVVLFVRNWLSQPEQLSLEAQQNLLNLYAITSRQLLWSWDSSLEDFSKVMHPKKVELLFEKYKSEETVNPLFLNFHMASIEYYGQINFSPKIHESFEFITDYFREVSSTIQDDIDLCLFFNKWSAYYLTVELLMYRFNDKTLNEEASFLLAKTYVLENSESGLEELLDVHKLAIKFNRKKWCEWIDKDFQNLRYEGVKNLYCKACNN